MTKIKNLVFDIGNVLMNWDPEGIYNTLFNKDDYFNHPISSIVGGEVWQELDKGTIEMNAAIEKLSRKNEQYSHEIDKFIREAPHHIYPLAESVECALKYKGLGYNIYLLSNFPEYGYKIIRSKFDFFNQFDGEIISWNVNAIKPYRDIYDILLSKYNLKPEATVFIDDLKENIIAAEKLNIKGLHLTKDTDLGFELKRIIDF
jgi:HAD superfamily hydrolase (TIGR01509 family)